MTIQCLTLYELLCILVWSLIPFRFTHSSPLKTIPKRTPLSSRTAQINQRGTAHQAPKMDIEKMKSVNCVPEQGLPECHLVAKALNAEEVEGVWKAHTLNK